MDLLKCLGGWLIFDGVVSIVKYCQQTLAEHFIRVLRVLIGLAVVILG